MLTGDWVPDHEHARTAGLDMEPGTLGAVVYTALRTSRSGVFAVGNLLHPVDTADIAALDGPHVAEPIRTFLRGRYGPPEGVRRIVGRKMLPWPASPGRVFRVPSSILGGVDPCGGVVSVSLR